MNKQLKAAIEAVEKARASEANALKAFNAAERSDKATISTASSNTADRVQTEVVDPAQDLVDKAERDLMNAPVEALTDALHKAAVLLRHGVDTDAIARVQEDIQAVLIEDPLPDLCERWKRLHRMEQDMFKDDVVGWFETPELIDLRRSRQEIEAEIMGQMPRTPEALASLVDMYWINDGPAGLPGTEGWQHEMNNPTNRLLAHIRRGAAHIAGLDRGGQD